LEPGFSRRINMGCSKMTSIVVNKNYFSGNGHVYDAGPDGLAAIIRSLAIDNARSGVSALSLSAATDNTTGTAGKVLAVGGGLNGIIAPSGIFDAAGGGAVQAAAFNSSLGKIRSAEASMVATINKVAFKLGLPALSIEEGTAVYNTILAQDLAATTAATTSALDYTSFVDTAVLAVSNMHSLFLGVNAVLKALGMATIPSTFVNIYPTNQTININGGNLALFDLPAVVAAVLNTALGYPTMAATAYPSVSLADGTKFLQAMANNFATLIAYWNNALNLSGPAALTDANSANATATLLPVIATPLVGYTDISTSSASASAINSILTTYQNDFSSLQAKLNSFYSFQGLPSVNDNSGGTPSTSALAVGSIAPAAGAGGAFATGTLTEATATNFIAGDTMTIGNQTFNFVTPIGNTPGNILVRANTAAGFALTMGDVIASMASVTRGLPGATANYVPNTAVPDTVVASLVPNAGGGATYSATALVDGVGGNALVFSNTSTHSEVMDGSGYLGGTVAGAAATSASLTSLNAAFAVVENNISTIAAQLTSILLSQGEPALVDYSGGVSLGSAGVAAIPALTVADNVTAAVGVVNTAAITVLTAIRNDISSLNAVLTAIIAETNFVTPISVVAG
jgi:hypothetical protein